jgi:hypothetical protein
LPSFLRISRLMVLIVFAVTLALPAFAAEVGVYRVSPDAATQLMIWKATVRHGRMNGELVAELTPEQAETLRREGYRAEQIYPSLAAEDAAIRSQPAFDLFRTYEQIRNDFYAYAAAHPDIARLVVLGLSVQNREVVALRISDNPDVEENEPEVAFWGGIHGNEYGAGEVACRYALYLCDNYGIDANVTGYVDDNEIWCIPLINPDGRVLGQRANVNGVDLNRDFGYQWNGEGGSPSAMSQVETRITREFCVSHNISLSTTVHCSGNIVFFPWGYAPQSVPDLGIITSLSQQYAAASSYAYGNSWQDYETHGELLDHVYGAEGGICLTIEVSNSASLIPDTFARNRAGMNLVCSLADEGIHGVVTDAETGEPVAAAVRIAGNPIPSYSDPDVGDVHRLVPAGTYTLIVSANEYLPQTVPNVVVAAGNPGTFQVALQPGGNEYAYRVTSVNQRDPNNAYTNTTYPSAALGEPDNVGCSLGSSGFIVLDFGAGHEIIDVAGDDFTVVEAITVADPSAEAYRVYAGGAYDQNVLIGSGTGTTSFDLAAAGVGTTRYLRILDISGAAPNGAYAGMDLDAVVTVSGSPVFVETPAQGTSLVAPNPLVYPNPFRNVTTVRLVLQQSGPVELRVFDAGGREVIPPLGQPRAQQGVLDLRLDGSDLGPGQYFYTVQTEAGSASGRLLLVR